MREILELGFRMAEQHLLIKPSHLYVGIKKRYALQVLKAINFYSSFNLANQKSLGLQLNQVHNHQLLKLSNQIARLVI